MSTIWLTKRLVWCAVKIAVAYLRNDVALTRLGALSSPYLLYALMRTLRFVPSTWKMLLASRAVGCMKQLPFHRMLLLLLVSECACLIASYHNWRRHILRLAASARESSNDCPVCMESCAGPPFALASNDDAAWIVYRCGHACHWKCSEAWLRRGSSCPLCRKEDVFGADCEISTELCRFVPNDFHGFWNELFGNSTFLVALVSR